MPFKVWKFLNPNYENLIRLIKKLRISELFLIINFVRMIGIEPTWVTPLDPKSSASASFATSANGRQK